MPKKNIFTHIQLPKVGSNRFDLSHDVKLSFKMGELVPTACMEVLPGDRFSISPQNMLRFAPLISPVMHKVRVTTHYFFVPNRILWPEWEKWITGDSDVAAPYVRISEDTNLAYEGTVADYLGYPTGDVGGAGQYIDVSPLPMAAYKKIWDDYYRDQNLQDESFTPLVPGDNSAQYVIELVDPPYKRAWQHDYFTSALPFAQKGDSVQLPLVDQGAVPVEKLNNGAFGRFEEPNSSGAAVGAVTGNASGFLEVGGDVSSYNPQGSLVVDIQADAVDVNTVRRAFRLQEWLEKNARGGTRYIENIMAHFGIKSSDARLQRPEYIGGSKQNMVISEVLATAENTEANVPVGNLAGHGISVGGGNSFNYRAEEHGWIIGIINVQPDTAYSQGCPRHLSRFDRLDYAWPTFANIGEQEILNKELYVDDTNTNKNGVFGYIPRYSEYRFTNSRVAGEMKTTLDFWHLARKFESTPNLNLNFIKADPSTRIFAVTDENVDHIYAHIINNVSAIRKLPRFGIPTI